MSASTVSITANTRRRPVVVAGKKQNVEFVNDVVISPNSGGGTDDKFIGGSGGGRTVKDPSHSITGEAAVVERSIELLQLRMSEPPSSTAVPVRRTRRSGVANEEKHKWKTVLRIFIKNFVLLLVLIGLVQMVRKLVVNSRMEESGSLSGFTDMEGRIAELNLLLKNVAKMMQVQLDAADTKLEGEVGGLRSEIDRKIGERFHGLEIALRKLGERSETLEKAVSELSSKDFLTKDNFIGFYEELRKAKVGVSGQNELTLDEISTLARAIVEEEIEKHAADGLGRIDHALASGGGRVVKHSDPVVVKGSIWQKVKLNNYKGVHENAEKMLTPSFGEPGQCFALKGSSGFVEIRLRTAIVPEAITLEHVAKNVAYDRTSAPKDCQVFGWLQAPHVPSLDDEVAHEAEKMLLLTEFTYDLDKSNAQTFQVRDSAVVDTVRFDFISNHGNPSFTCIYRLRVHGIEAHIIRSQLLGTDS